MKNPTTVVPFVLSALVAFAFSACGARSAPPPAPVPDAAEARADSIERAEAARAERRAEEERIARERAERTERERLARAREEAEERRRAEAERERIERERRERESALERELAERAAFARAGEAVLPRRRIVAFYGNPQSERMGILGELPPDQLLAKLEREVAAWEAADPSTPVLPALHMIAVMAAGDPGPDGKYRVRMPSRVIERVIELAGRAGALVFLDIQPSRSTVQEELPRLLPWLERPNVHLALDPEWNMGPQGTPGHRIGSMSAETINYAVKELARLVARHDLPPKVLVVHRFTEGMVRNADAIVTDDPRVQVVLHMDGWGAPTLKRDSYRSFVAPVADVYKGFKLFYKNDTRGGSRLMTPTEVLQLKPAPIYIQYQ